MGRIEFNIFRNTDWFDVDLIKEMEGDEKIWDQILLCPEAVQKYYNPGFRRLAKLSLSAEKMDGVDDQIPVVIEYPFLHTPRDGVDHGLFGNMWSRIESGQFELESNFWIGFSLLPVDEEEKFIEHLELKGLL